MRWVLPLLCTVFVLAFAGALDVNAIDVNVVPPSYPDFNVYWEVNNENNDWNYFVVSFVFGEVFLRDGDYEWNAPAGNDFNTGKVFISDGNHCSRDQNDQNIYRCVYTVNVDNNFLRNGPLTIKVLGWKKDGNAFESDPVEVNVDFFAEINASLQSYSSSGELNILITLDCNVNEVNSGAVLIHTPYGDVNVSSSPVVSGSSILVTISGAELNSVVRGTVLELNAKKINAGSCIFAPDTNVLVTGLPDSYVFVPAGEWAVLTIPYSLDENYQPTRKALFEDLNTVIRYVNGGWVQVSDLLSESYTLVPYYVYSETNRWIPLRWSSATSPSPCKTANEYVTLSAGWNLVSAYCLDGNATCPDHNSSLVTLSFIEANTETNQLRVAVRPLYQYYGLPGSEGNAGTFVGGYGEFNVPSGSAVWVWINPLWAAPFESIKYYGPCVTVPELPGASP